jgi:hypothetical protein
MQKTYWLPPHVRACFIGDGAVVLDLKRNRYFGIGQKETSVLAALAGNWQECGTARTSLPATLSPAEVEQVAAGLIDAGLLSQGAAPQAAFTPAAVDLQGMLISVGREIDERAAIKFTHVIDFMRSCAWARSVLGSRSLYSVAMELSDTKTRANAHFEPQTAARLVHIFRQLRPYAFPAKDRCLFHALTLVRFLSRYRIFATWVIGVRGKPWAAHSWVQQGALLLDATPEQVCEYTPILAI